MQPRLAWNSQPCLSLQDTRGQACTIMLCRDDGFNYDVALVGKKNIFVLLV